MRNRIKERIQNGEKLVGLFITSTDPALTEVAAIAGYDFVVIDTEHGPLDPMDAIHHIRAAEAKGIAAICRTTNTHNTNILRLLDIGSHGVQVPQVNSLETAKEVVQASKYYPKGNRGMALPRGSDYGLGNLMNSFKTANEETLVVVHCETTSALDKVDEIAALDEIDVIFLGPFDMSQSMGIPGQTDHPLIKDAVRRVLKACQKNDKAAGIFAADGAAAREYMKQGFQYVTINVDLSLLGQKLRRELDDARS